MVRLTDLRGLGCAELMVYSYQIVRPLCKLLEKKSIVVSCKWWRSTSERRKASSFGLNGTTREKFTCTPHSVYATGIDLPPRWTTSPPEPVE